MINCVWFLRYWNMSNSLFMLFHWIVFYALKSHFDQRWFLYSEKINLLNLHNHFEDKIFVLHTLCLRVNWWAQKSFKMQQRNDTIHRTRYPANLSTQVPGQGLCTKLSPFILRIFITVPKTAIKKGPKFRNAEKLPKLFLHFLDISYEDKCF